MSVYASATWVYLSLSRLEQVDWQAQAELLKQQTLATLSDRDQQVRQLGAMLEEARATRPKPPEEHHQRQVRRRTPLNLKLITTVLGPGISEMADCCSCPNCICHVHSLQRV
jgi:hypothetical protein